MGIRSLNGLPELEEMSEPGLIVTVRDLVSGISAKECATLEMTVSALEKVITNVPCARLCERDRRFKTDDQARIDVDLCFKRILQFGGFCESIDDDDPLLAGRVKIPIHIMLYGDEDFIQQERRRQYEPFLKLSTQATAFDKCGWLKSDVKPLLESANILPPDCLATIETAKPEMSRQSTEQTTHAQPISQPSWRKAFEYQSEGLNALYDLIENYFFDERGNPIYDQACWPLKKNLISNWLTGRTLEEADTIITSGKRKGNAAK